MDVGTLVIAIVGLLAAGVIKGATGIGYSSCALPFLVVAIGLKPAVAMLVVPAMASNLMVVSSTGHIYSTIQKFWPLYIATLPGIIVGILVLAAVDQHLATKVLGVIIVAFGIQATLKPGFQLRQDTARRLRIPVGLLSGFFTGLTGSQVMPLMPYMLAMKLDAQQFVQAVNLAVITASLFLGASLMALGVMHLDMLAVSILAIIPALAGVQVGSWCRTKINDGQFRSFVVLVLTGIGAVLMIR